MAAVEESEESVAVGGRADVAEIPHLQLSGEPHLEELRPFLLDELHLDADRGEAALPHLLVLATAGVGRRPHRDHERLAVRKIAPAVAVAVDVAELVEQRLRAGDVVADVALEFRVVAGDARRDRLRRALRLALPEDADLLFAVVRHAERAAQRDALLRVAADDRVLHVEIRVVDRRLDAAGELHAGLREARLQSVAEIGDVRDEVAGNRDVVEIALLEAQEPRIAFLDDADLDAPDQRQPLPLHHRNDVTVGRIGALGKRRHAKTRIRLEHDLLAASPVLEPVRSGADRIRHRPGARIAVRVDHLAGDRRRGCRREIGQQAVRRVRQLDSQRVAIERLQALERRVVVELARFLRLRDGDVPADEDLVEHLQTRRADLGVEDPLP